MNQNDLTTVLWLTIEDFAGLWEAAWDLRSSHRDLTDDALQSLARDVVHRLLDEGLIEVLSAPDAPSDDLTPVPTERARELVDDPRWWRAPERGEPVVRISATDAGEARYQEMSAS